MKVIKEIVGSIKKEIKAAEFYAKMAIQWKSDDRALADTFEKMSRQELEHINMLHAHAVRIINAYKQQGKTVPPAMQAVWDYEHENQIEWVTRVNLLLTQYAKAA